MSRTNTYRSALSFAVPPCLIGAPGGTLVGVFVPRYETAIAFARLYLCGIETAIAFSGGKWAFLVQFVGAEVMPVSAVPCWG